MKRLLLLSIPLLLVGCGEKTYIYYNVDFSFNIETMKYDVYHEQEHWKVDYANVYTMYVEQYHACGDDSNRLAINEFYVKGKEYKLFVYRLSK